VLVVLSCDLVAKEQYASGTMLQINKIIKNPSCHQINQQQNHKLLIICGFIV